MRVPKVQSIDRTSDLIKKNKNLLWNYDVKIGSKITGLALDYLDSVRSWNISALFPAVYAAHVMSEVILPSLKSHPYRRHRARIEKEGTPRFIQKDRTRYQLGAPIGLRRSNSDWINAWMQFILYLPKFSELISLAEKSFASFAEFVEQYAWDQKEGKGVSLADTAPLLRCLAEHQMSMHEHNFYTLCRMFFTSMFPEIESVLGPFLHDSIVFHPEWVFSRLETAYVCQKQRPVELVIAVEKKGSATSMKRQLCLGQGRYLYDLDALIEWRVDGARTCFVTYVRVDGAWFSCEDEKVRWISSRTLSVPLARGVLFHYKQVVL